MTDTYILLQTYEFTHSAKILPFCREVYIISAISRNASIFRIPANTVKGENMRLISHSHRLFHLHSQIFHIFTKEFDYP